MDGRHPPAGELRNLDPKLADSLVASWSGPNSLAPEQVDEIVRNANSSVKPSPHSSDESELAMATQAYDERAGLRAIPALSRLAGKGIPKAQYLLGEIFIDGSRIHPGVRKDGPRGWGWVKKAAENGYPEAQWYLGTMCSVGTGEDGVPQSKELGFSWLQKAANKGFAQAMVELGSNYREGWGTTQSYKDALLWYRKAARKGDSSGMMLLGEMYESGQGVTQDFIEAHAWLNLASSNEKPGDSLISKMRDNLASKMSSSQLEKAQRRAKALAMEIHRDKSNATP